jgi:hypothetical protein
MRVVYQREKDKMARPKSINYINNAELYKHLSEYIHQYRAAKAAKTPLPKVPRYVGEAILLIAKNLATKSNFGGYSFRDEMIGDGCENCLRYLHNFNPEKSTNPFGYLSLILYRAFVRRIVSEKKESYTKHKMILNNSDVYDTIQAEMAGAMLDTVSLDKSSEIVRSFEESLQRKKDKIVKE